MDFPLMEAGPNASGSSSYISARLVHTLSYNLNLSAFEMQFLNCVELLNSCKYVIDW